jgi:hypothetical protein
MIFGLLIVGLVLISSALKNTEHELAQLLQDDILGTSGFLTWAGALMAIGAIGYLPGMRQTSRYLLALIGVVMIVRNGGAFANAQAAIMSASALGPAPSVKSLTVSATSAGSASSGGSAGAGASAGGTGSTASGGDNTGAAIGTIASDAAMGAAVGGPYGAVAGAAVGIISEVV